MPLPSSSSDEVMALPSVPRRRRGSAKATASADTDYEPPTVTTKDAMRSRDERQTREMTRGRRSVKRNPDVSHMDDEHDDHDDHAESEETPPVKRMKRTSRRTMKARKIVEEEDDDESGGPMDSGNGLGNEESDMDLAKPSRESRRKKHRSEQLSSDKSNVSSPPPASKKVRGGKGRGANGFRKRASGSESVSPLPRSGGVKRKTKSPSSTGGSYAKGEDFGTDDQASGSNDMDHVLKELEKEADAANVGSDPMESEDSTEQAARKSGSKRLTRRQRALQGEKVELEFGELEKSKKPATPEEDWSHDEEIELKRQQKARLRQMVNEKRNKEKRAAMVDKVLRGVTSKRKKLTMAWEARAAQVGSRLIQNEMREGCVRFVSNKDGISVSLPKASEESVYLQTSVTAVYPRACTRDPRTGKRVFVDT